MTKQVPKATRTPFVRHLHLSACLILFLLAALPIKAQKFTAVNTDGVTINYSITSDSTVGVTYLGNAYDDYFNKYSGTVNIPVSVTHNNITYAVTSIKSYAFFECVNLTTITIPSSITSIGDYAFYGCNGLTAVDIPSSVTSIEDRTFMYCENIVSITIPSSVNSIGENAFYYCSSLFSVDIPTTVTSIWEDAFENVRNVRYFGSATGAPWGAISLNGYVEGYLVYADSTRTILLGCSPEATDVTIPLSVTSIGRNAFSGCINLASIAIPSSVSSIGGSAFSGVRNISYHGTATGARWGALSMNGFVDGYLVYADSTRTILLGCSPEATDVTIPSSVTSIGERAFSNCSSLISVSIPSSVTSIGRNAFSNCSSLTSITIPTSITSIDDYAFSIATVCPLLKSLHLLLR